MVEGAPAILVALEGSALGQGIRESIWAYPAANVLHVVAVTAFVSAVVVMDLALLGTIGGFEQGAIVRSARRVAIATFLVVAATGLVLFTAEASHVALNRVFQIKIALVLLGLANALFAGRRAVALIESARGEGALPRFARGAALVSLLVWFAVVAAGRMIAYY
jgi:hypothetical protein